MKAIDLFSGCGGLSQGFEEAGFEVVLAIDYDEEACETHRKNHSETTALQRNLREVDIRETLEEAGIEESDIDVVIGGPPCRGFSIAGDREEDDDRNSLVDVFLDWVEFIRPNAFLMENVPGIVTMYEGKFKAHIINRVEEMGYDLNWKVLNAARYGVPQSRERAIFVGLKGGKFEFPNPTHKLDVGQRTLEAGERKPAKTVGEAISDLPSVEAGEETDIPNHVARNHGELQVEKMKHIDPGENWESLPEKYKPEKSYPSHAFHRLDPDKPSRILPANASSTSILHPEDNRQITVREFARIQSFPDDYIFHGNKSGMYRQVGDAVPPKLAEHLAEKLKSSLKS